MRPSPLRLIGPPGTQEVVDSLLASLRNDIGYRIAHHEDLTWEPPVEVMDVTHGVVHDDGMVRVIAEPTEHRPVRPTIGYRVESGGHTIVLAGDTVPCEGLDRLCEGADALVITVVRNDLLEGMGIQRLVDVCDYHSTVEQAADTAKRAAVQSLVLTHCVPPIPAGAEHEWRSLAAELVRASPCWGRVRRPCRRGPGLGDLA